jgi:CBS domain-containing protein
MVTNVNALQLQDSVQTAIDRMVQGDISQLPVISEQGNILGIVSESSVLQKGAHRTGLVEQVMDRNPPVIDITLSVSEARRRLVEVEVLLVTEQDLLVGLVSRMDLVNALRLRSIG